MAGRRWNRLRGGGATVALSETEETKDYSERALHVISRTLNLDLTACIKYLQAVSNRESWRTFENAREQLRSAERTAEAPPGLGQRTKD